MITASKTSFDFDHFDDTITLDETARHRRRMKMVSDNGMEFLLDLPEAKLLGHGECLILDDGRIIKVLAEPEMLYEVRAKGARHLLALAWQLGNRHLPAQIFVDHILIRRDHVIKDMLLGLGAEVQEVAAPFTPENGAYAAQHQHGHSQSHSHSHSHGHNEGHHHE